MITHIEGDPNTGGDGMSHIMKILKIPPKLIEEIMSIDNLDREENDIFSLDMGLIKAKQENDKQLKEIVQSKRYESKISSEEFDGQEVTTFNDKIWVPEPLQDRIVLWHHKNLMYPGLTRLY